MLSESQGFTFRQMQALSDEELMAHAQAGHHDALTVIVSLWLSRSKWWPDLRSCHSPEYLGHSSTL